MPPLNRALSALDIEDAAAGLWHEDGTDLAHLERWERLGHRLVAVALAGAGLFIAVGLATGWLA